MYKSKIKYANIRAEMARDGLTMQSMAEKIRMPVRTLSVKLMGHYKFTLIEAYKIKIICFSDKSIEYLFKEDIDELKKDLSKMP